MSKPILIVAVIVFIDVVFVKKIIGPTKFWLKKFMPKKNFRRKNLGQK